MKNKLLSIGILVVMGIIGFVLFGFGGAGIAVSAVSLMTAPISGLSPEQMEEMAERYMNFEGNFEGSYYDGSNDDLMDFGGKGSASFLTENGLNRQFIMQIANKSLNSKECYITPGNLWWPGYGSVVKIPEYVVDAGDFGTIHGVVDASDPLAQSDQQVPTAKYTFSEYYTPVIPATGNMGFVVDGAFPAINDSDVLNPSLNGLGNPKHIRDFFAFINYNPTNLMQLRISSSIDDDIQTNYTLEVEEQSPFRSLSSKVLHPSTYIGQDSNQKSIVKFDTPGIILSNQTRIKYTIGAAESESKQRIVTITFVCGGVLNTAASLEKKRDKAMTQVAQTVRTKPQLLNYKR